MLIATLGSFETFLCFTLPGTVFIKSISPSRSIHTGEMCGEPSAITVATYAKFLPSIISTASSLNINTHGLQRTRTILQIQSYRVNPVKTRTFPVAERYFHGHCPLRKGATAEMFSSVPHWHAH